MLNCRKSEKPGSTGTLEYSYDAVVWVMCCQNLLQQSQMILLCGPSVTRS